MPSFSDRHIKANVFVMNMPREKQVGFIVARQHRGRLWFYGNYESEDRAYEIADEIGNGVVVEATGEDI